MRLVRAVAVLAFAAPIAGCAGAGANANLPIGPAEPPIAITYKLGTGDKVRVITFGEAGLSGEFTIDERGGVAMPLVGEVKAGGLNLEQFSRELENTLSNGYLKNPRVSVEVLNYRPFYILGEISRPGQYPYTTGLTVTNAVATAGGFTYRANLKVVFVKGLNDTKERSVPLIGTTLVHPGDTIRIAERMF